MRREMQATFKESRMEITKLQEEIKRKEEEWGREKQQSWSKIEYLELQMEAQEKRKKKSNIILKGLKLREKSQLQIKEKVEEFLNHEVSVKVQVDEAYTVGK